MGEKRRKREDRVQRVAARANGIEETAGGNASSDKRAERPWTG